MVKRVKTVTNFLKRLESVLKDEKIGFDKKVLVRTHTKILS